MLKSHLSYVYAQVSSWGFLYLSPTKATFMLKSDLVTFMFKSDLSEN